MKYYILGSGSKGNCTIVKSRKTAIMIDCGLSLRYTKECLEKYGIEKIDSVLITHSHSDHIKNIKSFKKLEIYSPIAIEDIETKMVTPYEFITIGDIKVLPIKLSHDAKEVVGYIFSDGEILVYLTDTGRVSSVNEQLIENATYYIFEANHDVEMLMHTNRPLYLKSRINSDLGHMNNEEAGEVLSRVIGPSTKEIILAHLSQEANTPELAFNTVIRVLQENDIDTSKFELKLARQDCPVIGGNDD